MIKLTPYRPQDREAWDTLAKTSTNGTFLFQRDYMEYHADRFEDASLMVYKNNSLIAVLPANRVGDTLYSHQGLTYGGFVCADSMDTTTMLETFDVLVNSFKKVVYKPVPHIYHSKPSEEDLYALFRYGATLKSRAISVCTLPGVAYNKMRQRILKAAAKHSFLVKQSDCFGKFMDMLTETLIKHKAKPTHSVTEIEFLASKFPNNIKLFMIDDMAGIIVYESAKVAHAQYIASTEEGRNTNALSVLTDYLIKRYAKIFDFGISTENNGLYLNEGLIKNKESYGARGITYDCYAIG